ncbi:MAG: ABC transporter ATP-binding protein [Lachnospiraceae bacterium]|nr:ABC transporter ATP-binding protein [Lachnospiraceae bacterium]
MISFSEVSKRLGGFELKDVSFDIPEGYICGLVGRNGAGKTTLLNLILGLLRPKSGEISIDGMGYEADEKNVRKLFGCVLVDELLIKSLPLTENGEYFGHYYEDYDHEMFGAYLKRFELDGSKKFGKLSKGEKLKCQFAFALAVKPKYLMLDEPTANFDPQFRENFWKILKEFIADGEHSVLLATHLTDDLDRMADQLLYIENGKMIFNGDMESFRDRYKIVSGESYLIKGIDKQYILGAEKGKYSSKALTEGKKRFSEGLSVAPATIEEFMYYRSKGDTIK